jgi:uncharacterized hydrophobic protein (TIGR00271 family)
MPIKKLIAKHLKQGELQRTVETLLGESILKSRFFILLFLSTTIATLGLLTENVAVTIGAMVIAPLLTPLLCFSMGALNFKPKMIVFGLKALVFGSFFSIVLSALMVQALQTSEIPASLIKLYEFHGFEFIYVALFSGMAGAYSSLKKETQDELIGVAIAAALVPPLAFAGISLGVGDFPLFKETLLLYVVNLLATSLGAMLIYAIYIFVHRINADKLAEKTKE